jgi:hypothetical protein
MMRLLRHCATKSVLRASPGCPSMATRATHALRPWPPVRRVRRTPRDGDHYSDRLLAAALDGIRRHEFGNPVKMGMMPTPATPKPLPRQIRIHHGNNSHLQAT